MKTPLFLTTTAAALAIGSSSCKSPTDGVRTVLDATHGTAELVARTVVNKQDTEQQPDFDRVHLRSDNSNIDRLYKRLDDDGRTTSYSNVLCGEYEKTMKSESAGRMADVVSRLWTMSGLIHEKQFTREEINDIVTTYKLFFSGIHEQDDPPITTILEGNLSGFLESFDVTLARLSGESLTLIRGAHSVIITIDFSKNTK